MRHGRLDIGATPLPPQLPPMHPFNASWYTSATYELLATHNVFVRVEAWRDRVHQGHEIGGNARDRQRNVVQIAGSEVPALAKILRHTTDHLHPDYVVSSLDGHGKSLDVEVPGDGLVHFHVVNQWVMQQRSFKPSTRGADDSLLACPRIAVQRSLDPEEVLRSPYLERAVRYLWAFGTAPVIVTGTRSSLAVRTPHDDHTQSLVVEALRALTGEEHKNFGTVQYGTAQLHLGRLGHEPDLSGYRYVNPLVTRITI
jgi:hypothetical protein